MQNNTVYRRVLNIKTTEVFKGPPLHVAVPIHRILIHLINVEETGVEMYTKLSTNLSGETVSYNEITHGLAIFFIFLEQMNTISYGRRVYGEVIYMYPSWELHKEFRTLLNHVVELPNIFMKKSSKYINRITIRYSLYIALKHDNRSYCRVHIYYCIYLIFSMMKISLTKKKIDKIFFLKKKSGDKEIFFKKDGSTSMKGGKFFDIFENYYREKKNTPLVFDKDSSIYFTKQELFMIYVCTDQLDKIRLMLSKDYKKY